MRGFDKADHALEAGTARREPAEEVAQQRGRDEPRQEDGRADPSPGRVRAVARDLVHELSHNLEDVASMIKLPFAARFLNINH